MRVSTNSVNEVCIETASGKLFTERNDYRLHNLQWNKSTTNQGVRCGHKSLIMTHRIELETDETSSFGESMNDQMKQKKRPPVTTTTVTDTKRLRRLVFTFVDLIQLDSTLHFRCCCQRTKFRMKFAVIENYICVCGRLTLPCDVKTAVKTHKTWNVERKTKWKNSFACRYRQRWFIAIQIRQCCRILKENDISEKFIRHSVKFRLIMNDKRPEKQEDELFDVSA